MTSFYITGGWGYGNKGDNAIFEGMRASFKEHYPNAKIVVTSYSPDEMKVQHGVAAITSVHRLLSIRSPLAALRWIGVAFWRMTGFRVLLVPSLLAHLHAMQRSSVVVLGGGGYFNDAWPDMLRCRYVELELANAVATPVLLYGQTIGPFSEATIGKSLARYLKRVAMIAYRDEQSLKVLQACGVPEERLVYTADEANLLVPADGAHTGTAASLTVGVMVQKFRPHLSQTGPSPMGCIGSESAYETALIEALVKLGANHPKLEYLFIPSTRWDEPFCQAVSDQVSGKLAGRVRMLADPTSQQFITACQSVNLMISTNMHPVILAATASAPSVAISYHYKLDDYMASVGLGDFVLRIDDFSGDSLLSACNAAILDLDALRNRVGTRHKAVRDAARRNMLALQRVAATAEG